MGKLSLTFLFPFVFCQGQFLSGTIGKKSDSVKNAILYPLPWISGFVPGYKFTFPRGELDPFDITENNLTFRLYTRKNIKDGVLLPLGDKSKLQSSGFKGSLPTKLCTHGYMDDGRTGWILQMKDEFLKAEDLNFVVVDWSMCAKNVFYEQVVECMKEAGTFAGEFLKFLQRDGNLDLGKAHLIGHSLGAHLISFASNAFPGKKVIGRVTGLDPAGPLFEHVHESERLNSNSAKFVDVIHTCRIFTGMLKPVGTVDFYPNGGYFQPGCGKFDMGCHHRASHQYFIATVDPSRKNLFAGRKCESLENAINGTCQGEPAVMGYHTDKSSTGIYYVNATSVLGF